MICRGVFVESSLLNKCNLFSILGYMLIDFFYGVYFVIILNLM